jgi:hypothetical protein
VLVAALAALLVWTWAGRQEERRAQKRPTPTPAPEQRDDIPPRRTAVEAPTRTPTSTPTHVPAPRPAAPGAALPAIDLFAGEALELLSRGNQVVASGKPLAAHRTKELFEFGKENSGDARPYLLLGADWMNRGWFGFAVSHYLTAFHADPRARQDPRVLPDLLTIAGNEHYGDRAVEAIEEMYGAEAFKAIEDAVIAAGDRGDLAVVDRLGAAADRLRSQR